MCGMWGECGNLLTPAEHAERVWMIECGQTAPGNPFIRDKEEGVFSVYWAVVIDSPWRCQVHI